ncbi:hypothetical protein PF003_g19189 [Phytophthora fragariae]|nr:hypothetical protein PF003_g19189 [Phytophthora fragariae]
MALHDIVWADEPSCKLAPTFGTDVSEVGVRGIEEYHVTNSKSRVGAVPIKSVFHLRLILLERCVAPLKNRLLVLQERECVALDWWLLGQYEVACVAKPRSAAKGDILMLRIVRKLRHGKELVSVLLAR